MKEKLQDSGGLTLVETLCAIAIMVLLGLMIDTGVHLAVKSCQDITAQSEAELLLSTLSGVLADDLRYAQKVTVKPGSNELYSYNKSAQDGGGTVSLDLQEGQLYTNGRRLLPAGAYGLGAYQIAEMYITYKDGLFEIELEVKQADGGISARTHFAVRCLNG